MKNAISSAPLTPASFEHSVSVSLFCQGGFTPSQRGSLKPPAVFEEVHLEEVQLRLLFLWLPSSTCLLIAIRFCLPFLPRWIHAISTGFLRALLLSSRRYIWRRYNKECYFFGCPLPLSFLKTSVSVSLFCPGGFTPSQRGSSEPPCRLQGGISEGGTMKTAISTAALFLLPPSISPFLSPFSAKVASRHLKRAPKSHSAVIEEVHLKKVQ